MKISIITAGTLPMPPVNGGAVENLIEIFLQANETSKEHSIDIYSCFSERARKVGNDYICSAFHYIETTSIKFKIKKIFFHMCNKVLNEYYGNAFIREVVRKIKNTDIIIIENRPEFVLPLRKHFSGTIIIHLHNDLLNYKTRFAKRIVDSCNQILTVSDYIKNRVLTIEMNDKVKTIYNCVNTELFNKAKYIHDIKQIKKIYNIDEDDIVILYSGRLNRAKGIDLLLKAFVNMSESPKCKLLIVGSSIYGMTKQDAFLDELKKIAAKRSRDIIFTGYIDYWEIPRIHSICDIAVIPSVWDDPSPLTVYEAMSSGLPIITTDSGGIPELVNTESAIIIERSGNMIEMLKKELEFLVGDSERRKIMSIHARQRAMIFKIDEYVQNINSAILDITG